MYISFFCLFPPFIYTHHVFVCVCVRLLEIYTSCVCKLCYMSLYPLSYRIATIVGAGLVITLLILAF